MGFHILLKSCDANAIHFRLASQSLWYDRGIRMENTEARYRKWTHIAFTWEGNEMKRVSVFINGHKGREFSVSTGIFVLLFASDGGGDTVAFAS